MAKHGKKYVESAKLVDSTKVYSLHDAVALLKKAGYTKFDGSVEIAIKTFADAKYNDQMMRGTTILPHGTGKSKRIAVYTTDEAAAKKAWADIAGTEELLKDIKAGKFDFDILLTTPEHIRDLAPVAKQLGPKGLMPSPKAGTVAANIIEAIQEFKKGKMEFKLDKSGNINASVGRISFTEAQIEENIKAFMKALEENKPVGVKGKLMKKIFIAPTMGPGIQIEC
ncbi:MAG: 50S ribosomal protein L1 [uncultured bacterium (gcode 4)]|uniref:Large ribosomal subunit protein uL1 n=1 Tax=uncultured bacterium (gcode 4) TaxID=1234023 RepID=K1YHW2_9BACT|nr:MAG: 50S ribosomal protein L1 [uncultured bacterium (gcode 4)]